MRRHRHIGGEVSMKAVPYLLGLACICLVYLSYGAAKGNAAIVRAEDAARVFITANECTDKCPSYKYGAEKDNEDHHKCMTSCQAVLQEKIHQLYSE
jgi:hypothetical protein